MRGAFVAASAACPAETSVRNLRLLGRKVRLHAVGAHLGNTLDIAFAHLVEAWAGGDEDSSIELWDRTAAAVAPPDFNGSAAWRSEAPNRLVTAYADHRFVREDRPESSMWLDRGTGRVVGALEDARQFLLFERARPFSRSIGEICRPLGGEAIHAAMVGHKGRGILIVGGSGRGKTTSSLDCLAAGLDFLADDTVAIVESNKGGFVGHSLYASARVHPPQLARWPALAPHWIAPGPLDDKAMLLPIAGLGRRLPASLPIAAIVVPQIGPGPVSIRPTSGAEAFHALVLDSAENRRFALRRDQFEKIARLTRGVPSFRMEVTADPLAVANGFSQIIEDLA